MRKKTKPVVHPVPKVFDSNAVSVAYPRRDTKKNWDYFDPTLRKDELAWESDTNRFKIGDGKKKYTELDYFSKTTFVWGSTGHFHVGRDI